MRGKEYLCAVRPCGDGLLLETLHYADELREAAPYFSQIEDDPADADLLDVAKELIERKTAPFDAKAFEDHHAAAMRDLIDRKLKNKKTPRAQGTREEAAPESNVVDLMDALRKSLKEAKGPRGGKKKAS
jgi:DNA end-binding protein Ku